MNTHQRGLSASIDPVKLDRLAEVDLQLAGCVDKLRRRGFHVRAHFVELP